MTSYDDFLKAYRRATIEELEYLEVSADLFRLLNVTGDESSKDTCLTYGHPGVKVYIEGYREEHERIADMSAEQHHEYIAQQKRKPK